jgi:hypothetical protein
LPNGYNTQRPIAGMLQASTNAIHGTPTSSNAPEVLRSRGGTGTRPAAANARIARRAACM